MRISVFPALQRYDAVRIESSPHLIRKNKTFHYTELESIFLRTKVSGVKGPEIAMQLSDRNNEKAVAVIAGIEHFETKGVFSRVSENHGSLLP